MQLYYNMHLIYTYTALLRSEEPEAIAPHSVDGGVSNYVYATCNSNKTNDRNDKGKTFKIDVGIYLLFLS